VGLNDLFDLQDDKNVIKFKTICQKSNFIVSNVKKLMIYRTKCKLNGLARNLQL